jgi:hypothetical protein
MRARLSYTPHSPTLKSRPDLASNLQHNSWTREPANLNRLTSGNALHSQDGEQRNENERQLLGDSKKPRRCEQHGAPLKVLHVNSSDSCLKTQIYKKHSVL